MYIYIYIYILYTYPHEYISNRNFPIRSFSVDIDFSEFSARMVAWPGPPQATTARSEKDYQQDFEYISYIYKYVVVAVVVGGCCCWWLLVAVAAAVVAVVVLLVVQPCQMMLRQNDILIEVPESRYSTHENG